MSAKRYLHANVFLFCREECKRLEAFVMESKGNMSLAKSDFEKIKTELSGCRVLLQVKLILKVFLSFILKVLETQNCVVCYLRKVLFYPRNVN